jgi:hypothetical protein
MRKKGVLLLGIIASFLCALNLYLFLNNLNLKKNINELDKRKEKEFKKKLAEERALLGKDLDEKHKSELVSFEATYKSLNIEKKRTKSLEEKLKKLEKK